MKIDQNIPILNNGPAISATASPKTRPCASSQETPAADLSRSASLISLRPSSGEDFDAGRVEQIRQSINAGNYQVNTARIADGLISTVHDLLSKKPS